MTHRIAVEADSVAGTLPWPERGAVTVWRFAIDVLSPQAHRCLHWLSEAETDRLQRYITSGARTTFLVSRCALRWTLSRYLQVSPDKIALTEGAHGKPMSVCNGLRFNLSHSGECLLIAVSGGEVGVDVEVRRTHLNTEALCGYLAPEEAEGILATPAGERRDVLLRRCWSRKEALAKAIGLGLALPLSSYSVPLDTLRDAAIVNVTGHGRWWLHALPVQDGGEAALASDHPLADIRLIAGHFAAPGMGRDSSIPVRAQGNPDSA